MFIFAIGCWGCQAASCRSLVITPVAADVTPSARYATFRHYASPPSLVIATYADWLAAAFFAHYAAAFIAIDSDAMPRCRCHSDAAASCRWWLHDAERWLPCHAPLRMLLLPLTPWWPAPCRRCHPHFLRHFLRPATKAFSFSRWYYFHAWGRCEGVWRYFRRHYYDTPLLCMPIAGYYAAGALLISRRMPRDVIVIILIADFRHAGQMPWLPAFFRHAASQIQALSRLPCLLRHWYFHCPLISLLVSCHHWYFLAAAFSW